MGVSFYIEPQWHGSYLISAGNIRCHCGLFLLRRATFSLPGNVTNQDAIVRIGVFVTLEPCAIGFHSTFLNIAMKAMGI